MGGLKIILNDFSYPSNISYSLQLLINSLFPDSNLMPENAVYKPRTVRNSIYYQCVEDYFEVFEQVYEEPFESAPYKETVWTLPHISKKQRKSQEIDDKRKFIQFNLVMH